MGKKYFLCCGLVLLMAAAVDPLLCSAEGDPLASPTPRPRQRVAAPEISGVNPEVVKPEGDEGEITPSGGFPFQTPLKLNIASLPSFVELAPQESNQRSTREGNGSSGQIAGLDPFDHADNQLPPSADRVLPWMGLIGAMATLALAFNRSGQTGRRSWIVADSRHQANRGNHYSQERDLSSEGKGWVQVGLRGLKRVVPVYETRRVRAGFKKVLRQVPVYKHVKVPCGSRLVEKKVLLTRFRTQQVWVWKKVLQRVPLTRRIGAKRITVGYREQRRWKRVQVQRRVPYRTSKIILTKEPLYQTKKVQSGTRTVTRWVPRYQEKKVLVGYKTVPQTIPIFVRRGGQLEGQKQIPSLPQGQRQGESEDEPGLSEKERRLMARLLQSPVPEEELAGLLRKGIGPTWPLAESRALRDSWLYQTILILKKFQAGIGRIMTGLGASRNQKHSPHLFSISAYQEAPQTLLSKERITPTAYLPPHFMDLILTRQELEIGPKVEVTAYPEGLMNLNLTRRSWSMRIGNTTLFITLDGEVGFVKGNETSGSVYDENRVRHSLSFGSEGISIISKIEGVILYKERSTSLVEVKEIRTLKSQVTTLHTLGILVAVLGLIVIAALLYLYFKAGLPLPVPGELPL